MIKLVYCVRRRADVPAPEFHRYWLEEHGPLVRGFAEDMRAVRYVQSHTTLPEINEGFRTGRGLAEPYDGITEVWWESADALAAGGATEAGREAARRLQEDEASFIDFSRSRVFLTEEHEIFDLRT
ncbi:MAG: hypothetical protein CL910_14330 [Deltaproteobacteria bacterium]|nr:hypothetical protein [Deltaproteobacteria bacterium]